MKKKEVWIGLVSVTPFSNNNTLDGSKEAFVNALGYASSISEFTAQIEEHLNKLSFKVVEVEDAETFTTRIERYEVEPYILALAKEVELTHEFKLGNFHTYTE